MMSEYSPETLRAHETQEVTEIVIDGFRMHRRMAHEYEEMSIAEHRESAEALKMLIGQEVQMTFRPEKVQRRDHDRFPVDAYAPGDTERPFFREKVTITYVGREHHEIIAGHGEKNEGLFEVRYRIPINNIESIEPLKEF